MAKIKIEFQKIHGLGNDFVIFDNLSGIIPREKMSELAKKICDRHFGIGCDGLIGLVRGESGFYFMDYWNSDGSFAEMCGNGIRALAKYIIDNNFYEKVDEINIETGAGVKNLKIFYDNQGKVDSVKVNMGEPIFNLEKIPVSNVKEEKPPYSLKIDEKKFLFYPISMGNPHAVIFVDEITDELVLECGPKIETYTEIFPQKTNVEFIKILNEHEIQMRVWERGCGETLACGTGASASAVASIVYKNLKSPITVHLLGGDLLIEYEPYKNPNVFMTGKATYVFKGEIEVEI